MSLEKKSDEKGSSYSIIKWVILTFTGIAVIIIGLILIYTREFYYRANVDDLAILIYIYTDYFYIRFGFSNFHVFFILSVLTSNYFVEIIAMQLYFGLILCIIGEIFGIWGFIRVRQIDKSYWSRLFNFE